MADPLSIASAIAGLASVAFRISVQLNGFVNSARSAPSEIQGLANEIQEFCGVLGRLEQTARGRVLDEELFSDFRTIIDNCMDRFLELQMLIQIYGVKECDGKFLQQWKRWRWPLQREHLVVLRNQLETHKATLNIYLNYLTNVQTISVGNTTTRIEEQLQRLIEQLRDYAPPEYTPSYTLLRYISMPLAAFSLRSAISQSRENSDAGSLSGDSLQWSISIPSSVAATPPGSPFGFLQSQGGSGAVNTPSHPGSLYRYTSRPSAFPSVSPSVNGSQRTDSATFTSRGILRRSLTELLSGSVVASALTPNVGQRPKPNDVSNIKPPKKALQSPTKRVKENDLRSRRQPLGLWKPLTPIPEDIPQQPSRLSRIMKKVVLSLEGEAHPRPLNLGDLTRVRREMRSVAYGR